MSRRRSGTVPRCLLLVALWVGLASGCRTPGTPAATSGAATAADPPVEFELSFVGLCIDASAWSDAIRFHTGPLGMRVRNHQDQWAVLGAGWDAYVSGRSRALVCELFQGGGSAPAALELGLEVRDVAQTVEKASARGARFLPVSDTALGPTPSSPCARVTGPAGVAWSLRPAPTARSLDDLLEPEIMRVDLRVHDLPRQRAFYHRILGLPEVTATTGGPIVMQQHGDGPSLVLFSGGRRHTVQPKWARDPALGQKAFLGFMTANVRRAAGRLKAAGVRILRDVEHHDWGGTDLIAADADGNAVQVFTLDSDHRFGSARNQ